MLNVDLRGRSEVHADGGSRRAGMVYIFPGTESFIQFVLFTPSAAAKDEDVQLLRMRMPAVVLAPSAGHYADAVALYSHHLARCGDSVIRYHTTDVNPSKKRRYHVWMNYQHPSSMKLRTSSR